MPARNTPAGDPAVERGRRSLAAFLGRAGKEPPGFVGRVRELEEVRAVLTAAGDGRGELVLLAGDPGIGKTRLAEEAERSALEAGMGVAWGRCWEAGGAPAFWPWIQALRSVASAHGEADLPEPVRALVGEAAPDEDGGAAARFAVFDAVAEQLRTWSRESPLLIVLDDLHAADQPSLLLLQFVARSVRDTGLVVLGTYREAEARANAAVRAVLDAVGHEGRLLPLRGLGQADVAAMVGDADATFAREVWRVTEGNPFFVDEILRLHAAEAPLRLDPADAAGFRVPAGVRETIRRRLEPLPQGADAVLSLAAVAGREFTLELLAKCSALPTDRLAAALEAALDAELVRLVPAATERYRFAHVLIRDALYERLEPAEREALHGQLARVLEGLSVDDPDAHVAQLAHHFALAASAADADKAVEFCERAAEQARRRLAYEDAVAHLEQALALAPAAGLDAPRRLDLLLALARAHIRAGETAAAREAFAEAADGARALDDGTRLAHAAVGFGSGGTSWADGSVDAALVGLLEEAAEDASIPPALRATLLAKLADALVYARDWDRTDALTREAIELARASGDPAALIAALSARSLAIFRPATLDERLAVADELIAVGEAHGASDGVLAGYTWAITTRLERGDRASVDDLADRFERAAQASRQPHQLWGCALHQTLLALLDGRIDDAERLAGEAVAAAQGAVPLAGQMFGVQLMSVRREQGRMAEVEPAMAATIENYPAVVSWRLAHAAVLAILGRFDEAQAEYRRVTANGPPLDPRDYEWPPTMGLLGPLAALMGDTPMVQRVYDELLPWADRMIVVSGAVSCEGSVARTLGILAAVLGRWADSDAHFAQALASHDALGSPTWSARTRADWARMLALRGRRGR